MPTIRVPAIQPTSIVAGRELYTEVLLTSQEVKALAATPIDLVPAPGAGLAVIPTAVYYFLDRNAAYDDAAADGDLVVKYDGGSAIITSEADAFIDAAADAGKYETIPVADFTPTANTKIVLGNSGAEFTGDAGNANTLLVRCFYRVVPFA